MAELQNKIAYEDFYTNAASDATVIEHAVSILKQIYDYLSEFTSISVNWFQNSETANITIKRNNSESYYVLEVTTVGATSGQCKFTNTLVLKNGTSKSMFSRSYTLANWKAYGQRFLYLSTANVFVFNVYGVKTAEPVTGFNEYNWGGFMNLANGSNLYHTSGSTFYKDDGTTKSLAASLDNAGDQNKVILANLTVGGSVVQGMQMLRTSDSSSIYFGGYYYLEGYGKYYALYGQNNNRYAYGIKLGD